VVEAATQGMPYRSEIPASAPTEILLNSCGDCFCCITFAGIIDRVSGLHSGAARGGWGVGRGVAAAAGKRERNR
jgi:hypothetical protein